MTSGPCINTQPENTEAAKQSSFYQVALAIAKAARIPREQRHTFALYLSAKMVRYLAQRLRPSPRDVYDQLDRLRLTLKRALPAARPAEREAVARQLDGLSEDARADLILNESPGWQAPTADEIRA